MKNLFVLVALFLTLSAKADVCNIPPSDLRDIKYLFDHLITVHDFAYPIFGSKPMALADFCLDISLSRSANKFLRSQLIVSKHKRWLDTFHAHKNEVNFRDFIFLDNEEDLFENVIVFLLINKKNLLRVLKENEEIFKQELGDSFTSESFLEKLENRETSVAKAINHNYGLLGIMLGYGVRNSILFQEKHALIEKIEKLKGVLDKKSELYKKYQEVCSKLQPFNEFEDLSMIMPIHFLADTAQPETTALRAQYKADQQKIVELMSQPNFMDRVLERLMK